MAGAITPAILGHNRDKANIKKAVALITLAASMFTLMETVTFMGDPLKMCRPALKDTVDLWPFFGGYSCSEFGACANSHYSKFD